MIYAGDRAFVLYGAGPARRRGYLRRPASAVCPSIHYQLPVGRRLHRSGHRRCLVREDTVRGWHCPGYSVCPTVVAECL